MGSVTRPRGRLPRRVYWVRRGLVLAVAALLVFGVTRLVGGLGTDSDEGSVRATTAGASTAPEPSTSPSTGAPTVAVGPVAPPRKLLRKQQSKPVLAAPDGDCVADDVSVLPMVEDARAGRTTTIGLQLSGTQPACTFEVSPESMVVKITSGSDRIWSSQQCPKAIPKRTVVVRSGTPVTVPVQWHGRRSDEDCSKRTAWALPGFYHVYAAALGSTPSDVQFELSLPDRRVVTKTVQPKPEKQTPSGKPATEPAGSTKPNKKPAQG